MIKLPRVPAHRTRQMVPGYQTVYRIDWALVVMVALTVLGVLAIFGIVVHDLLDSLGSSVDRVATIGGY